MLWILYAPICIWSFCRWLITCLLWYCSKISQQRENFTACLVASSLKQSADSSIPSTPLEDAWQHHCTFKVICPNSTKRNVHKQGVQLPKVQVLKCVTSPASTKEIYDKLHKNTPLSFLWMHSIELRNSTFGHSCWQLLLSAHTVRIKSALKHLTLLPATTRRTRIQTQNPCYGESQKLLLFCCILHITFCISI